ncbi:MAG: MerR family transcriptional regulator [Thermodesulfobacteriota bacterium]
MTKKKSAIQAIRHDTPIYPIGVAARLLGVHPRTLRIYEKEGLVEPVHHGARRLYSSSDIQWISCLRSLIHDQGISIPGLKKLMKFAPCWEIKDCPAEIHENCEARVDLASARTLHVAGDSQAEKEAKEADVAKRQAGAAGILKKKRVSK